ncbi:MAG: hypothetical protein GY754_47120, partial [bacterium]|nr:hypothetical protein [bacterium]
MCGDKSVPVIFSGLLLLMLIGAAGCEIGNDEMDGFINAEQEDGPIGGGVQKGYYLSTVLWDHTGISVCWENPGAGDATERGWVRDSIETTWAENSNLQFSGWGQCGAGGADIRIRIEDVGPHTHGLGDQLDHQVDGMSLNFTFNNWGCTDSSGNWTACSGFSWFTAARRENWIRSNAIHEFGHALGIAHEHNR